MGHPNSLCIHLVSDLFPCPWQKAILQLKHDSERLQGDIERIRHLLPGYLLETVELCQGCAHYDPVGVYLRKCDAQKTVQGMHQGLCRDDLNSTF